MNTVNPIELAEQRLLERAAELRADIRRELLKRNVEHYADLAGEITDRSEESVADLLVDVNLAEISRDVEELRDVEAALERVGDGTYGVCSQCGADIEHDRLSAVPAASRCYGCQVEFESLSHQEHARL